MVSSTIQKHIIEQVETYIRHGGGEYRDWFIGLADNPIVPIRKASRLRKIQNHRFVYIETISGEVAKAVADYFINVCGTDGDIIEKEKEDACRAIYIYKKAAHIVACEIGVLSRRFAKPRNVFCITCPRQ
jgi:hypothetical protein